MAEYLMSASSSDLPALVEQRAREIVSLGLNKDGGMAVDIDAVRLAARVAINKESQSDIDRQPEKRGSLFPTAYIESSDSFIGRSTF